MKIAEVNEILARDKARREHLLEQLAKLLELRHSLTLASINLNTNLEALERKYTAARKRFERETIGK